jgi:uncharacterized protein (TIGR02145 family)
MKKLFFLFAMLAGVAASATVTITPLTVNYNAKTVIFRVEYANAANNRVWIWIDLCPVSGVTTSTFQTAVISAVSATGGSVDVVSLNGRGFYVTANPSTVTATLSNAPAGKFNWCAYGSDYPPNVTANNGTYTLRGTPPFILKDVNDATQTIQGKTIPASSLTIVPMTMTDATGCTGYFCPYVGSDLYFNPTYKCQQRASGAKNWEAWIKDTRDDKLYRIVHMPDNKWWLAQNVKYGVGSTISGCTEEECGLAYTWEQAYASYAGGSSGSSGNVQGVCPSDWLLPIRATFSALATSIGNAIACANLRPLDSACQPITNAYGFASSVGTLNGHTSTSWTAWYTNDEGREDGFVLDQNVAEEKECGAYTTANIGDKPSVSSIRCFRQL